jgi:hypothetical protein
MNKHIELVKKWLADPESVTQQELDDNRDAAECAYYAAVFEAAANSAYAAAADATHAVAAAAYAAKAADYWVKRYEELTEQGE